MFRRFLQSSNLPQRASLAGLMLLTVFCLTVSPQKKSKTKQRPARAPSELEKLQQEFVRATNDYKASLEKLLNIYEGNVVEANELLATSKKLFDEGLVARVQVEESELAVKQATEKVLETKRQMEGADAQVAAMLVETSAEEQIAKNLRLARSSLVRTNAFIRYTGTGGWNLGESWKIQRFFSDAFNKQLPVAVFGQGAIHDRWRLDHRNAMDISLHPDGIEGRALLEFLQKNGIPYSAFRAAIPGTATGPHIHIGRPSHRY